MARPKAYHKPELTGPERLADVLKADYGAELEDGRIDLAGLYALDQTWAVRGDTFNAVFDQELTVWEAMTRMARCGRAVPFSNSRLWTFTNAG